MHLSDDQLLGVCLAEPLPPREQEHLQSCAACSARRHDVDTFLRDASLAAEAEADAAFPPERLAKQHARILQRLANEGRAARVIAFPGHSPEGETAKPLPRTRWLAGAAAAGLVIGLVAGHMSRDLRGVRQGASPEGVVVTQLPMRTGNAAFLEEELLGQIEMAVASPSGSALGTLNDLTPRAWEVK